MQRFYVYKLVGTHLTRGKDHVYVANVGIDVLGEVMRAFREVLVKRHGEYWREYFDFVSRREYFPRGPSVFVVSVAEREFLPMVRIFCFSKNLPEVYESEYKPAGEVEVGLLFGRYGAVADIGGRIFVGGNMGSREGALCFMYSTNAIEFLFDYSLCRNKDWKSCGGLTQDEAEDIIDLLTKKL